MEKEDIELIKQKYNEGLSQNAVAEIMGVNHNLIRKTMKENNIFARTDREQALIYSCNENFFEVVDNEAKAYWLGFMYADGYITSKRKHNCRKIGISISKRDVELLHRFKKDIESTHPINEYKAAGGFKNSNNYVRIIISSEKLVSDAIKLGVFEAKTEILRFPNSSQVPKKLLHHFIRGYMDGDGSISEYKKKKHFAVSFCGTREMLMGIQKFLHVDLALGKRHDNDVNNYSFAIGGNRQVENILDVIYSDATIFLKRKHAKYVDLQKQNIKMDLQLRKKRSN